MMERKRDEGPGDTQQTALQAAYWAQVYEQCHGQVRAYFARKVRCPHDVEDLVQEVFASLILRGGRLQEPMIYIRAVARHHLLAYWRRNGRRNLALRRMETLHGGACVTENAYCDWDSNPLVQLGNKEFCETIVLMLDSLPRASAEILRLRYMQGMDPQEAASRTGCSREAVKKRLTRAKQSLARLCSGQMSPPGRGGTSSHIDPALC